MKLKILPVTRERWPALEDLFGKCGASNGCWCMYWRLGPAYRQHGERNRRALRKLVESGSQCGLLAFHRELAVGWCQLTPRAALPYLERYPPLKRIDDLPVWSISCFYVRRGYRLMGVASALLAAAVKEAKRAKAPVLEAYPSDPNKTRNDFTGARALFLGAGFEIVASRGGPRSIARRELTPHV
jgi:GNAT superfamily N-acetyltransferase